MPGMVAELLSEVLLDRLRYCNKHCLGCKEAAFVVLKAAVLELAFFALSYET
jgi:hypothetical protein